MTHPFSKYERVVSVKKALFATTAFAMVFAFISGAFAQTYSDVTKYTGTFGNRSATINSGTVPAYDDVRDTRAGLTVIASATAPNISGTLTMATKDGSIVSTSSITLNSATPTVITVNGPLYFQKVKVALGAPGAATAKVNLVQSR
jgi:hypothetical protein